MNEPPRGCTTGWHGSHSLTLCPLYVGALGDQCNAQPWCDVCGERPACGSISDEPLIHLCGCCAQDWVDWMRGHQHGPLLGEPVFSDDFAALMEVLSAGRSDQPVCTAQSHWREWKRFVAFTTLERQEQQGRRETA